MLLDVDRVVGRRYRLLELLGRGGAGAVYRAYDGELDETVALKLLLPAIAASPIGLERFRREVKLARRVTHRNVARTFELGSHQGMRFLTMEYVAGESLAVVIDREGPLPIDRIAPILDQICGGLAAAHEVGVVHRDIKPSNIMIADDGRVVITDFGVACAENGIDPEAGSLVGTPAYMAPEQIQAGAITPRTDVFALGIVLFELLTGEKPWRGRNALEVARRRLITPPPRACERGVEVPEELEELLADCMAKPPEQRPATTREVWRRFARAVSLLEEPTLDGVVVRPPPKKEQVSAPSIAVLPFSVAAAVEDTALERLLSEGVADALCRIRGVRVLSPRIAARAAPNDPREAGRRLGVQAVVEGAIERSGDAVVVSVRVLQPKDGVQTWADRFQPTKEGLAALPEAIARSVASALSIPVERSEGSAPMDALVLELYLRARRAYRQYAAAEAVELLERALQLAPEHPLLSAWLVAALVRRSFLPRGSGPISRALAIAERAAARAPDLGEAHFALALALLHAGDPVAAARALRRAVALAPSLAEANGLLGDILVEVGRLHDGIRRLEVALALDGELTSSRWAVIRALTLDGRTKEAARAVDLEAQRPHHRRQWIPEVRSRSWLGDHQRLLEIARELTQAEDNLDNRIASRTLAFFLGRCSAREAYEAVEARIPESCRGHALAMQTLAEVAAHAGDIDVAVDALQRASDHGLIDLAWLDRCRLLEPLRSHPRFAVIRQIVEERADRIMEALWGGAHLSGEA